MGSSDASMALQSCPELGMELYISYQQTFGSGLLQERRHDLGHDVSFWPREVPGDGLDWGHL